MGESLVELVVLEVGGVDVPAVVDVVVLSVVDAELLEEEVKFTGLTTGGSVPGRMVSTRG